MSAAYYAGSALFIAGCCVVVLYALLAIHEAHCCETLLTTKDVETGMASADQSDDQRSHVTFTSVSGLL